MENSHIGKRNCDSESLEVPSCKRQKKCSLPSFATPGTGADDGDCSENFTKEQESTLLKMPEIDDIPQSDYFDIFTEIHPRHPFTRAEVHEKWLSLRAEQSASNSLPELGATRQDLSRQPVVSPYIFTAKNDERILQLDFERRTHEWEWSTFCDRLNREFPQVAEKDIRRHYVNLAKKRDHERNIKLILIFFRAWFSPEIRDLSPIWQKVKLWPKIVEEMNKLYPGDNYSQFDLKFLWHKLLEDEDAAW